MKIKEVNGRIIKDSRKDKTIEISVETENGLFVSSAPSGKSRGKHEKPYFMKKVEHDITTLNKYLKKLLEFRIHKFDDLKKIENLLRKKIGSNTLIALESALLKALAAEKGLALWQVINPKAKKVPYPVGNCIGGGLHTENVKRKKPDFQEFLIIPKADKFVDNVFLMKNAHKILGEELKVRGVRGKLNDENAWSTSLDNEEVLKIMNKVKDYLEEQSGINVDIGVDIASSSFFTGVVYNYKNEKKRLTKQKQIDYVSDLIDKYNLDYVEDPLEEEEFLGINKFRYRAVRIRPTCLITGDDLIASQLKRFEKALRMKSINAVILKPNQVGSLLEIAKIVGLAKKYRIKIVFSHRSGETLDYSLADLAFGFQADYIKTGIIGKEREIKLKRLIGIERDLS